MKDFIEPIVIFGLIGIVVGLFQLKWLEDSDKNSAILRKESKGVVRLPSFYKWLGLLFTIPMSILPFGNILFPKIFENTPLLENLLINFPLILLGLYALLVGAFWNIQVDKNSDYFIYRTMFGRSYKILYSEISYYKTWKNLLLFRYKRKFFFVSPDAINYDFFLQMLIKKDVKKKFKPFKSRTRL